MARWSAARAASGLSCRRWSPDRSSSRDTRKAFQRHLPREADAVRVGELRFRGCPRRHARAGRRGQRFLPDGARGEQGAGQGRLVHPRPLADGNLLRRLRSRTGLGDEEGDGDKAYMGARSGRPSFNTAHQGLGRGREAGIRRGEAHIIICLAR
jgi:hypothetical protein